jgi:hypothetical protein
MSHTQEARVGLLDDIYDKESSPLSISQKEGGICPVYEFKLAILWIRIRLMVIILILAPRFLGTSPPVSVPKKLHPTADIDGLTSTAAFFCFVFIHYTFIDWFPVLSAGSGSGDITTTSYVMQMPIIRIIYSS